MTWCDTSQNVKWFPQVPKCPLGSLPARRGADWAPSYQTRGTDSAERDWLVTCCQLGTRWVMMAHDAHDGPCWSCWSCWSCWASLKSWHDSSWWKAAPRSFIFWDYHSFVGFKYGFVGFLHMIRADICTEVRLWRKLRVVLRRGWWRWSRGLQCRRAPSRPSDITP